MAISELLTRINTIISEKYQKSIILLLAFMALTVDNLLMTVIVPIIPDFLYRIEYQELIQQNCSEANFLKTNRVAHRFHGIRTPNLILYRQFEDKCVARMKNESLIFLNRDSVKIGIMFASKPFIQLLFNLVVGPLTNKIGYSVPLFNGFLILFGATMIFAFARSYALLFIARTIQGVASSLTAVSCMGMVATYFTEDQERGKAFGFALSGIALGVLLGPIYGGIMYQYTSKDVTFIIIAVFCLAEAVILIMVMKPKIKPELQKGASLKTLITDPYIFISAVGIIMGNLGIATMEPSLPAWVKGKMGVSEMGQGLLFIPISVSYLISTNIMGSVGSKIGRWLTTIIGMVMVSVSLFGATFSQSVGHFIVPFFTLGFSIGLVDASLMPMLGNLVDLRHSSIYGSVYSIADVAFCSSFVIGPLIVSAFVPNIGFQWTCRTVAILIFCFAPFILFLRNVPAKDESEELIMDTKPKEYRTSIHDNDNNKLISPEQNLTDSNQRKSTDDDSTNLIDKTTSNMPYHQKILSDGYGYDN